MFIYIHKYTYTHIHRAGFKKRKVIRRFFLNRVAMVTQFGKVNYYSQFIRIYKPYI